MFRVSVPIALIAVAAIPSPSHGESASISEALEAARPVKPLRGLVYDEAGIVEARRQAAHGMHQTVVQGILKQAREWADKPDEEVAAIIPPAGSLFAYGMAGDPKSTKAWPRFGREGGMCSWDRPGTVRSPHTGDIYGAAKEGEPYYDPGTGWRREDGQIFYFKGIWNAWVVDRLHEAVDNLALAYMLTGDAGFARRALFILDRLAALRASLPQTGNSAVDWPHKVAQDDAKGFFHYMGNIANQRAIQTAYDFDLLANAPYAGEKSVAGNGRTVGDNIIKNYFAIYERRYLSMGALTNHGIILIANMITQGVLFGDAGLLRDGLDGMRGFFDNTINRDGDYMEVSGSYGRLGRDYGSRLIVPLTHYKPENYPNAAEMPDVTAYTRGVRPGDDPRWYRVAVKTLYRLPVLGRYPQYGDTAMDRSILLDQDNNWLAKHRSVYLRLLHWQTTREDWKREIEALYPRAARQTSSDYSLEDLAIYGPALWMEPKGSDASATPAGEKSDYMGGKGIGILRSGSGADARALFMRGGINSWHGQDDQMAIVPYGNGMILGGQYGYRWAGTPDYVGWGTRSISHNTVVVNEDLPAPYLYKGFSKAISAPAASLTGYVDAPPAQWMEMRNPRLWAKANLKDYRRTAWLIDAGPQHYYFVDLFRVIGGKTHDYAWTAPFGKTHPALKVEGIKPKAVEGIWTLAALGGKFRKESWNAPGRSWGERLNGENGMVQSLPGEALLPISKWNPEPGNGYGMIWGIKTAETTDDWKATWPLYDNIHSLRAHFVNCDGMTTITGQSPSMRMEHPFDIVVARRTGNGKQLLQSRFINVMEVGKPGDWALTEVAKVPVHTEGEAVEAIGLQCRLTTGESDLFLSSRTGERMTLDDGTTFLGRNAFIRRGEDGTVRTIRLQEGKRFETGGITIELAEPLFQATVLAVETAGAESKLQLDRPLPEGETLTGYPGWIDSPNSGPNGYLHNAFLAVEKVEKAGAAGSTLAFKEQSLVVASLDIVSFDGGKPEASLRWAHGLAGKAGNLSYKGNAVVPTGQGANEKNPALCLVHEVDEKRLALTRRDGLSDGQRIDILLAKPGDVFTMPATVSLDAPASGPWTLRTSSPLKLKWASGSHVFEQEFPAGNHQFTPSHP